MIFMMLVEPGGADGFTVGTGPARMTELALRPHVTVWAGTAATYWTSSLARVVIAPAILDAVSLIVISFE